MPQRASRQRSKLAPGNPAGVKRVQTLLRYRQIAEKMLPGPPEPTKPVVEVPACRWTANWSGERSWGICSVLAMLLVVLFALADQGLPAVTRHHHSVALDVVYLTTTSTMDELMGKSALRTELPLQTANIDVIGLKRTDDGLENEMRRACVSCAKPVGVRLLVLHQSANAGLVLGSLKTAQFWTKRPWVHSKSATLTTSSKLPESGYPEKSIAMMEEVDTRQMYPIDVAHGERMVPKTCCPSPPRNIIKHKSHNACDRLPNAADHVSATTVHMSWFYPSHRDGYLKSQQAVTNNPQWLSLGAHLETAGNRGVIGIVIRDDPKEDGPAEAPENARSPPKPVPWFCCKNVITATTLHAATGDVEFCSSHKNSDLKANRIIGNRTWLMSPVDVRSGQIERWCFCFLDTLALVGLQWKLTLWKLAAQAMLPCGTAQHEGVQASMAWREEMVSAFQESIQGCKGKAMHETQANEAGPRMTMVDASWATVSPGRVSVTLLLLPYPLPKRVLLGL
ncbi:hypothetical protein BU17DRAFT_99518 [Hysterangium stoloniferum]|nr:hypothetical protein BU17DRAFT_99518 [Hysterangium stoloniferum]